MENIGLILVWFIVKVLEIYLLISLYLILKDIKDGIDGIDLHLKTNKKQKKRTKKRNGV